MQSIYHGQSKNVFPEHNNFVSPAGLSSFPCWSKNMVLTSVTSLRTTCFLSLPSPRLLLRFLPPPPDPMNITADAAPSGRECLGSTSWLTCSTNHPCPTPLPASTTTRSSSTPGRCSEPPSTACWTLRRIAFGSTAMWQRCTTLGKGGGLMGLNVCAV